MPLHLTFNTHDAEALEALVGAPPEGVAERLHRADDIEPGFVQLDLDGTVQTVEINDFDPLTAGVILARFAQQDDREALRSWPLTGDLDFEGDHYASLVGCDDVTARATAQSYSLMVELAKAIEEGTVEDVAAEEQFDYDTVVDAISHEHHHPNTLNEHGGEG